VRVVMDQDLAQYQWIWAAAGTETAVLRVAPRVLRMLSNAIVAPIASTSWLQAAAPHFTDGFLIPAWKSAF